MRTFTCATCGGTFDWLEEFPNGLCVACYAKTAEGRRMPTASEVVAMWGGK